MTPQTKCGYCTNSKCCTYITQQIDTPRSKRDFDFLLWQISHRDIRIYKDEGSWYMLVDNLCTHLQRDGRCGIYEDRPEICREYSNDYCEYDQPAEEGFELYFENQFAGPVWDAVMDAGLGNKLIEHNGKPVIIFSNGGQNLLLTVGSCITLIALWLIVEAVLALRRFRQGQTTRDLDIPLPGE